MDVDVLDSTPTPTTVKAGSVVNEVRETVDPTYISGLLFGILRGYGHSAVVDRITKRIGDEVLWHDAYQPWRQSPLWLVLRVTPQTSLHTTNLYKISCHSSMRIFCVNASSEIFSKRVTPRDESQIGSVSF